MTFTNGMRGEGWESWCTVWIKVVVGMYYCLCCLGYYYLYSYTLCFSLFLSACQFSTVDKSLYLFSTHTLYLDSNFLIKDNFHIFLMFIQIVYNTIHKFIIIFLLIKDNERMTLLYDWLYEDFYMIKETK